MRNWLYTAVDANSARRRPGLGSNGAGGGGAGAERLWSDTATWGGSLPIANDAVVIPNDAYTYVLDIATPILGSLTINGKFKILDAPGVALYAKQISNEATGVWTIGTAAVPYANNLVIELSGARPTTSGNPGGGALVTGYTFVGNVATGNNGTTNDNQGVSRGIIHKPGSQRYWYGVTPTVTHCYLGADATAGGHTFILETAVTWKAGQRFLVTPDGFWNVSKRTEIYTLAADVNNSTTLTTVEAIGYNRFGRLQYPTDAGLSFTAGAFSLRNPVTNPGGMKADAGVATVLDERAHVELVTRPINVQGANDGAWSSNGFGVHDMVMGLTSKHVLNGVRFNRCGQRGLLGRYPMHWHQPSINPATGALIINPATGNSQYASGDALVTRCVVEDSANRGISIHGTHGLQYVTNTIVKVKGHALFLEDGSEMYNVIDDNGIYMVDDPLAGNRLLGHDERPTGIWYTNPGNYLRNNRVADCGHSDGFSGVGLHNIFPEERAYFLPPTGTRVGNGTFQQYNTFEGPSLYFNQVDRAAFLQQTDQTWTFTALNSTTFSMVGSFSGNVGNITVGADNTNYPRFSNLHFSIVQGSTPFQAGDQFICVGRSGGGVFGTTRLAGTAGGADIHPGYMQTLEYTNNKVWSCRDVAVQTRGYPVDDQGLTASEDKFNISGNGIPGFRDVDPFPLFLNFFGTKHHHNGEGYSNRVGIVNYEGWTVSSNQGPSFFGVTNYGCFGQKHLFVGKSLHPEQPTQTQGFATYHGTISFINCSAYNYPLGDFGFNYGNRDQNLMATSLVQSWDLYMGPIAKELANNTNLCMFNCNAMWNTPPPSIFQPYYADITAVGNDVYTSGMLSAMRWDKTGQLGSGVANAYIMFNHPFLTAENTVFTLPAVPVSADQHAVYTMAKALGFEACSSDCGGVWQPDLGYSAMEFRRVDSSYNDIANATWHYAYNPGGSFHHVAAPWGARIRCFNPTNSQPSERYRWIHCAGYTRRLAHGDSVDDYQILGFPWKNSVPAKVWSYVNLNIDGYSQPPGNVITKPSSGTKDYTAVGSRAALEGSAGRTFYQDTTNNMIWIKPLQHNDSLLDSVSGQDTDQFFFDLVVTM